MIDTGSKIKKTKEYAGIGIKYFSSAGNSPVYSFNWVFKSHT